MNNKYVRFGENTISEEAQKRYAEIMDHKYTDGAYSQEDLLEEVQQGFITWAQYDAILAVEEDSGE